VKLRFDRFGGGNLQACKNKKNTGAQGKRI